MPYVECERCGVVYETSQECGCVGRRRPRVGGLVVIAVAFALTLAAAVVTMAVVGPRDVAPWDVDRPSLDDWFREQAALGNVVAVRVTGQWVIRDYADKDDALVILSMTRRRTGGKTPISLAGFGGDPSRRGRKVSTGASIFGRGIPIDYDSCVGQVSRAWKLD